MTPYFQTDRGPHLGKLAFLLLLSGVFAEPVQAQEVMTHADAAGIAKRFVEEIDCSSDARDPHRHWCALGAVPVSTYAAPESGLTLLGISVALPNPT